MLFRSILDIEKNRKLAGQPIENIRLAIHTYLVECNLLPDSQLAVWDRFRPLLFDNIVVVGNPKQLKAPLNVGASRVSSARRDQGRERVERRRSRAGETTSTTTIVLTALESVPQMPVPASLPSVKSTSFVPLPYAPPSNGMLPRSEERV